MEKRILIVEVPRDEFIQWQSSSFDWITGARVPHDEGYLGLAGLSVKGTRVSGNTQVAIEAHFHAPRMQGSAPTAAVIARRLIRKAAGRQGFGPPSEHQ